MTKDRQIENTIEILQKLLIINSFLLHFLLFFHFFLFLFPTKEVLWPSGFLISPYHSNSTAKPKHTPCLDKDGKNAFLLFLAGLLFCLVCESICLHLSDFLSELTGVSRCVRSYELCHGTKIRCLRCPKVVSSA